MGDSKDLLAVLWSGADELRGKMDANEYKTYLLGLVFYKYLSEDVGLDSSHRKYKDGKLKYKLYFTSVGGTSNPAVLTVKGRVEADSLFAFLSGKIKIPFSISSTNYRLDW